MDERAVGQDAAEKNENAWIAVKKRMSKAPAVGFRASKVRPLLKV